MVIYVTASHEHSIYAALDLSKNSWLWASLAGSSRSGDYTGEIERLA